MKNIKKEHIRQIVVTLIITLLLALLSSFRSDVGRKTIFADSLLVISLVLIVVGIIFHASNKGDFDAIKFFTRKSALKKYNSEDTMDFDTFVDQMNERRSENANAPLIVGIIGVALSLFITYIL